MADLKTQRQLRQILGIDRLMGLDSTPLNTIEIPIQEIEEARPQMTSRSPQSQQRGPIQSAQSAPQTYKVKQIDRTRSAKLLHQVEPLPDIPVIPAESQPRVKRIELLQALSDHFDANYLSMEVFNTYTHINKTVFGEGDPEARLMFVGEGPGADEDREGRPFVGRSGQKLNDMIAAMGLAREEVYIANIVKLRPPGNRVPTPDEASVCMPYLLRQIDVIQPEVIVCLGATATKYLLNDQKIAITKMRGTWQTFHGIDLMPTFHPAYLLRAYTPENRKRVWQDLQKVMEKLSLPMPKGKK